jgi:predicted site-specific integrase-resolvase
VPIEIAGQTYYRTSEACLKARISKATLFRWLKLGVIRKSHRDRRGWRLFTEDEMNTILAESDRVDVEDVSNRLKNDNH